MKLASWTWGLISQPCRLQPRGHFLPPCSFPHAAWCRKKLQDPGGPFQSIPSYTVQN